MKKTGLGKGFDSLIPTNFDSSILIDKNDRVQNLFVSHIQPNEQQPRKHFDPNAIEELSQSIKQYGILQPLIVVPDKSQSGHYVIVAGERRWRAAEQAGLKKLPCIIREREELEQLEVSLVENVQRVDLSPIEQAVSIERLHREFNMPYSAIAKRLGKASTTINNIVRLLQLPKDAITALEQNKISEGHARAVLSLKQDATEQQKLLTHIFKNAWSVRQAEQYATGIKQGKTRQASHRTAIENKQTKAVSSVLNTKVTLRHTARGGRVELHFKDEEELQKLLDTLLGKS
jgi:ParB family chromosome partitioning protein